MTALAPSMARNSSAPLPDDLRATSRPQRSDRPCAPRRSPLHRARAPATSVATPRSRTRSPHAPAPSRAEWASMPRGARRDTAPLPNVRASASGSGSAGGTARDWWPSAAGRQPGRPCSTGALRSIATAPTAPPSPGRRTACTRNPPRAAARGRAWRPSRARDRRRRGRPRARWPPARHRRDHIFGSRPSDERWSCERCARGR